MAPDPNAASNWNARDVNEDDRKWTFMVFMGADTIQGNAPLGRAAAADLKEIASIAGSRTLDVFVEVHHDATRAFRYHFGTDGSVPAGTPIAAANAEPALIDFVESSILASRHRRKDHSILVLWGHAYDFAFARGRTRTGTVDSIDFIELSGMLQRLQDRMQVRYAAQGDTTPQLPTLDIVAFDACDVATVEMACQLQPFSKYLLGSEIGVPMPGWPYDWILDRLKRPKGRLMAPAEFGSYVVRRFCQSYTASMPVSLTFLNLSRADELRKRAEFLAAALSARIDDGAFRAQIIDLFKRSQTGDDRPYVDVADLCLSLRRETANAPVIRSATALGNLLLSPGERVVGRSFEGDGLPLIVEHGRNAGELSRLNGISLYAPHVASEDFEAVRGVYDQFVFARDTLWSKLVHLLAAAP